MQRIIYLNLAVHNLKVATDFYTGLGFRLDDEAGDNNAARIVVSDTISVTLLTHKRFADFIVDEIGDPRRSTQSILCLSAESREEADSFIANALANGGRPWKEAVDEDGMYGHSFTDPDGHVWEVLYLGS